MAGKRGKTGSGKRTGGTATNRNKSKSTNGTATNNGKSTKPAGQKHEENGYQCNICKETIYKTRDELQKHIDKTHTYREPKVPA